MTAAAGEILLVGAGLTHHNETPPGTETRGISLYFPSEDLQLADSPLFQAGLLLKMPGLQEGLAAEINALISRDWTASGEEERARGLMRVVANKTRLALERIEAWAKPLEIKRDVTRNRILGQLEQARLKLERDRTRSVDILALAQDCGLSRFHFSRLFKSAFGTAPLQYHQNIRLTRAADLLPTQTPSMIARTLGYPDLAAFSKAFKRRHGSAPSRFRGAADTTVD